MAWVARPRNGKSPCILSPGGAPVGCALGKLLAPPRGSREHLFHMSHSLGLTAQAIDCRPSGAQEKCAKLLYSKWH